jgi:hypothetical protein
MHSLTELRESVQFILRVSAAFLRGLEGKRNAVTDSVNFFNF